MLNYQLTVEYYEAQYGGSFNEKAVITVKNGIPESNVPAAWLLNGEKSTIPEFFSFIKETEEKIKKTNRLVTTAGFFIVDYHYEYHYPRSIQYAYRTTGSNREADWIWSIVLEPAY